jgi:hypothetical protein
VTEVKVRRETATGLLLGLLLALVAAPSERASGDDDLAVVKKAVEEPRALASNLEPREAKSGRPAPRWVKVRIVENGAHKSRVSVSLPLAMVRALGDDFPVEVGSSHLRLCEILRELETGQPLVEVKGKDSTVRVWVE